jgi:hypothetical protein
MLGKLYSKIARLSSLWTIVLCLVLFLIARAVINGRPLGVAQLHEMTGGVGILDLERGYSPERAYEILTAQGEAGRAFYLRSIIPLDFVFPLTYTLFFLTASTYIVHRLFPEPSPLRMLGLLPLVAGLADYAENVTIMVLLLRYPTRLSIVATVANALTMAKGLLIVVSMFLLVAGLVGLLIKAVVIRVRRKSATNSS